MNRKEFKEHIAGTFGKGLNIIDKKNADYSSEEDPFANFNNSLVAHVTQPQAILVRVMDKMSRIGNLLIREAAVKDESMEDTIIDAINYLAILLAWLHRNDGVNQTKELVADYADPKLVYYGPHPCQTCDPKGKKGTFIVKAGNGAPDYLEFDYPNKMVDVSSRGNWFYPNEEPTLKWVRHIHIK